MMIDVQKPDNFGVAIKSNLSFLYMINDAVRRRMTIPVDKIAWGHLMNCKANNKPSSNLEFNLTRAIASTRFFFY